MPSKKITNSTMISNIAYNDETGVLSITFLSNNKTYDYTNVPRSVYDEAVAAESIGKYFYKNIKGKYE